MKGNNNGHKYKPRPIKRHDHTGALVNYGTLEVGIVAGIRCLGNKETLLLIGAGLAKQKVPDYFYTQHHVRVPLSNGSALKVYAIKATDASSLAGRISARVQLKKAELINMRTSTPEETWENGSKKQIAPFPEAKLEPVQFKYRAKRVGKFRKFCLLIKRLFSK
jgi:hypothetical protein